jgi:hypothetical protein
MQRQANEFRESLTDGWHVCHYLQPRAYASPLHKQLYLQPRLGGTVHAPKNAKKAGHQLVRCQFHLKFAVTAGNTFKSTWRQS